MINLNFFNYEMGIMALHGEILQKSSSDPLTPCFKLSRTPHPLTIRFKFLDHGLQEYPLSHSVCESWGLGYNCFLTPSSFLPLCPRICRPPAQNVLPPHHITSFSFSSFRAQRESQQHLRNSARPPSFAPVHFLTRFNLLCVPMITSELISYLYTSLLFASAHQNVRFLEEFYYCIFNS